MLKKREISNHQPNFPPYVTTQIKANQQKEAGRRKGIIKIAMNEREQKSNRENQQNQSLVHGKDQQNWDTFSQTKKTKKEDINN